MTKMKVTRILEDLNSFTEEDLDTKTLLGLLAKHKALLLQNADGMDVEQFGEFVAGINLTKYPYYGGAAPRRVIPVKAGEDVVYTANESPPDASIPFHHELAQTATPPNYIFFFCDQPSETGGETALIDSTLVYRFVKENHPDFCEKLAKHGARYIRTLPPEDDPTSPIGRSWRNTYAVTTKEECEAKLKAVLGLEFEWLSDGCLKTVSEPIPAIKLCTEQQGNAVYQHTFHNSVIAAFVGWFDSRNDRLQAVRFGNDEVMDRQVLESIADYMEKNKVSYQWKKGDVFALNNRLVMHSRNPFTGSRKVYASMWGDVDASKCDMDAVAKRHGHTIGEANARATVNDPLTFGFWRLDNPEETVFQAIKAGYRRLDSACDYGNEVETGKGIQRAIDAGICKREDLHITSKLWNTYHKPEHVELAFKRTLSDLGLTYLDEYLIHFPISMEFTWAAMESLVDKGLTKAIGISNFNCQHLRQLLSVARIRPTTLQVELHPHNPQQKLLDFARNCGLRVAAFSPLGGTSYISLGMATNDDVLMNSKTVQSVAAKYNKTAVQIMLRWAVQRGTLPISKTSTISRMSENRAVMDFYLHEDDMATMNALCINSRYNDPGMFCNPPCPIYE
eukprot:GSChrysophyteH2.ASY1.ANO1.1461.1 assembled CDS